MLEVVPGARVGHVGLYRDPKTLVAVEYYFKMPHDMHERDVIVLDPMLATGNSAVAAVERLKETQPEVDPVRLPAGRARRAGATSTRHHPDVPIYTAAIDRQLERPRLHRARPGRRRRPDVRHALNPLEFPGGRFRPGSWPVNATPLRPVCFMVMPFGIKAVQPKPDNAPDQIDFDALWNKALVPLISELGYEPVRADQDTGASIILEMLERLYFSDLVVADMTIPNGNVYYEIGIRHACKASGCLLISADWTRALFDTSQMRRLVYPLPEGSVTDASAEAIKAALRTGAKALAAGTSPMYQTIPGFPDPAKIDPHRASVIRQQLDALSRFQGRVRTARLSRDKTARAAAAQALRDDYPATGTIPQGVALEVAMLLRDCASWQECIDYIDALPEPIRTLDQLQEQRSLALSKTGNHLQAIAALEQLIAQRGDSSERQGLIGGRYKKLANEAKKAGDDGAWRAYLDDAIDHYAQGMQLDLNDYFPSCNLPRLYRARGEEGDAALADVAAKIAYFACVRARERNPQDEWVNPTLLGAAFDAGDVDVARDYVKRVRKDGSATWKLESTLSDIDLSVSQVADPARREALGALRDDLKKLL